MRHTSLRPRQVVDAKTFAKIIEAAIPEANLHIIRYEDEFPTMVDPDWRLEALVELKAVCGGRLMLSFRGPDQLDDEWSFVGTLK